MDTLMGTCYFFAIGGMGWNLIRIKLQGDLEEEMRDYREYDLSHEKIKIGTDRIDPEGNYIVLANHRPLLTESTPTKPFLSYTMPNYAPYDPSRYSENHKVPSEFTLTIKEECQDLPFEVVFDRKNKSNFFDLAELPEDKISEDQLARIKSPSIKDNIFQQFSSWMYPLNKFRYVSRGIRSDTDQELLFVGGLQHDQEAQKIVMRNPKMVIGSDRLQLYDFLARRKTYWGLQSRMLLNGAMAVTAVHFVLVQVPQLTSRFFGDKVDQVSSGVFGAKDQSEMQEKIRLAKENQQAKKGKM